MQQKLLLNENNSFKFAVAISLLGFVLAIYVTYSIGKFNALKKKSVVQSNVVMRVIQHNVKCVCPHCGTKGLPTCPKCLVPMYWNGYQGTFICTSCGGGGFPQCPRCKSDMTWIEAK